MALTAAAVLNHARDLHPSLSTVNAPNVLGFRALSRIVSELYEEIAHRVPAFLGVQATVTLPLPVFTAGIDLVALIPGGWKRLLDGFFTYTASSTNPPTTVRGNSIPYEQRDMNCPLPAYTLRSNVLYLLGQASDYTNFSTFVLTYTPASVDISALTDTIPLPDDARAALVGMLAAFFLKRLIDDPRYTVTAATAGLFTGDAGVERARFLRRIWRTTQNTDYVIRDAVSGR